MTDRAQCLGKGPIIFSWSNEFHMCTSITDLLLQRSKQQRHKQHKYIILVIPASMRLISIFPN